VVRWFRSANQSVVVELTIALGLDFLPTRAG